MILHESISPETTEVEADGTRVTVVTGQLKVSPGEDPTNHLPRIIAAREIPPGHTRLFEVESEHGEMKFRIVDRPKAA